jgi:formamidopyrimidine-DNA glycosylase
VPELPEVETIVQDLRPRVVGRILERPRFIRKDVLRDTSAARAVRVLEGRRVTELSRRAKHAVFQLDDGQRMVVQPGMTGSLLIHSIPLNREQRRYAVFRAGLGRSEALIYRDVRRLGRILLLSPDQWLEYSGRLGPEPLERGFTQQAFNQRVSRSRQAIKKLIMDQKVLAGVGNIYANEALFLAGIDPACPGNRLTPDQMACLRRAVRRVLRRAIASRGTTFRDYRTGTGQRGGFQFRLNVYGRTGQDCPKCRSALVTTHAIDGRSTTYCPACQHR